MYLLIDCLSWEKVNSVEAGILVYLLSNVSPVPRAISDRSEATDTYILNLIIYLFIYLLTVGWRAGAGKEARKILLDLW